MFLRTAPLALLFAASCASTASEGRWRTETILDAGEKLGGCVVADLDPRSEGNEVAVVGSSGRVYIVRRDGDGWAHDVVGPMGGEMIQCVAGRFVPGWDVEQLLCVGVEEGGEDDGGRGAAYLVYRFNDAWATELVATDRALFHAAAVGDLDPDHVGDEALLAGYGRRALRVSRGPEGWTEHDAGPLPADAKCAVAFDRGVAVGCTDGSLALVEPGEAGSRGLVLDAAGSAQSRLGTDGRRLVVCRNDGTLALVDDAGARTIYSEGDRLRGAVLAELAADVPGLEAATAGYSGQVTVLFGGGETWRPEAVHQDTDKLHHLAAGELDGSDGALELVGCGYSGLVTLIRRVAP